MKSRLPHLAVALVAGALYLAGALEPVEHRLLDLRSRLVQKSAAGRVALVAIDPRSLAALDKWPWPRGYHATVLENMLAAGARRVAFDIDFSSRSDPEEDAELAGALVAAGRRAVLPVFLQWDRAPEAGRLTATQPIPAFRQGGAALATINVRPERDGRVRRYWPFESVGGGRQPSMALALARTPVPASEPFYLDFGIDVGGIPTISFLDALTGSFDRSMIEGRAVIVGATAVELGDQVTVPVHRILAGSIVQALALECLEGGRALRRTPPWMALAAAVAVGLLVGHLLESARWRRGLAALAVSGTALFAISVAVQSASPLLVDTSPIGLTLAGCYGLGLVRRIDRQDLRLLLQSIRLRSSEVRMRHVVQNSFDGIITISEGGLVESFNPAAEQLFGQEANDVLGRPAAGVIPASLLEKSAPRTGSIREAMGRRRDGSAFYLEATCTRSHHENRDLHVLFLRDITLRKAQEEALVHQATHDALTDLPNRALLQARMETVLSEAKAAGEPVAFLMLDLDRFKEINDTLGHHMGDRLLQRIAGRLRTPLQEHQMIARLGGDEFAVLLSGAGPREARLMASRLIDALREPFDLDGLSLQVDTSIGVSIFPEHGDDVTTLIQRADIAMYLAKKTRNTFCFYNTAEDFNSVRHLTLKGELRRAVEENHLILYFQPKISCRTGRLEGAEALVRWKHPDHGLVLPGEFIPLAEYTGLIKPITNWVLEDALRRCAGWGRHGLRIPVSVNCSARNLLEEDLPEAVARRLDACALPADRLILEITETAIIEEPRRALEVLTELARMGVRISIDDFGTGYSSLEYLRKLPARELKIDKSFVMAMDEDAGDAVIVRSTIDLAHNLGLQATAEGVDSDAVWSRLIALGCDVGQGYLFARPTAEAEFLEWTTTSRYGRQAESSAVGL